MVYHIIREEIPFVALNYLLSFRARKYTEQLVKYPRVLYFEPSKKCECAHMMKPITQ